MIEIMRWCGNGGQRPRWHATSRAAAGLLLSMLVLMPLEAEARSKKRQQQARRHFAQAETHYRLGNFRKAIEGYTKSYKLSRHSELLFNLGQSHMELGEFERAVFFYQQYLTEAKGQPQAKLVRERLAEAQRLWSIELRAAQNSTEQVPPPSKAPHPDAGTTIPPSPKTEPKPALADPVLRAPVEVAPAKPPKPIFESWWFWTVVGGVALGTAASITAVVLIRQQPDGTLETIDLRNK